MRRRSVLLPIGPISSATRAMRAASSGWLQAPIFIENRPKFIGADTPDAFPGRNAGAWLVFHDSVVTPSSIGLGRLVSRSLNSIFPQVIPFSLVLESFSDLVVARTLVEPLQHLPRLRGHVRTLVVFTGETPQCLPGIEPHDRDELDLVLAFVGGLTEELDLPVPGDFLASDLREDLRLEQSLVFVCVLGFRIPAPNPADHLACASSRLPMSWSRPREPSARSSLRSAPVAGPVILLAAAEPPEAWEPAC